MTGLDDQIVLGLEVAVKGSVRQPRLLHDVGHAKSVDFALSLQAACRFQDLFAIPADFSFGDRHG
jgi:hypothetical protein